MPRVSFAPAALRDLERLRAFLRPKSPAAARRAAAAISEAVRGLGQHPRIGRPVQEMPEYRELLIDFGDSGYVTQYRHEGDQVTVLALQHNVPDIGKTVAGFSGRPPRRGFKSTYSVF